MEDEEVPESQKIHTNQQKKLKLKSNPKEVWWNRCKRKLIKAEFLISILIGGLIIYDWYEGWSQTLRTPMLDQASRTRILLCLQRALPQLTPCLPQFFIYKLWRATQSVHTTFHRVGKIRAWNSWDLFYKPLFKYKQIFQKEENFSWFKTLTQRYKATPAPSTLSQKNPHSPPWCPVSFIPVFGMMVRATALDLTSYHAKVSAVRVM